MATLTDGLDALAEQLAPYEDDGAELAPEAVRAITHLLRICAEQARMLEAREQRVTAEHLGPGSNVVLWPVARRSIPPRQQLGGAA